jgi:hypothetical protein
MTTITTSTLATATAYGNQRKIDRTSNGVLWTTYAYSDPTLGPCVGSRYSTDNGASWTDGGIAAQPGSAGTTYVLNSSLFIDADDYAHLVFRQANNGYLYYRRGTPNAARTAFTWSAATQVWPNGDVPDLVAFRNPTGSGWVVHVVFNALGTNVSYPVYVPLTISASGVVTAGTSVNVTSTNYGGTVLSYPSIDFQHTGDGKTPVASPALFVGWSSPGTGGAGSPYGIRFRKASYTSGSWTWGTEREIDPAYFVGGGGTYWLNTLFDGTRVVMTGYLASSTTAATLVWERDVADTTSALRMRLNAPTTATPVENFLVSGSASYDSVGNVYLFSRDGTVGNGTRRLMVRRWTRSTGTFEAPTIIETTAPDNPYVSARRGWAGNRLDFIYTDNAASPYTVTYGNLNLNNPPTAPTPTTAAALDRTVVQRISWTVNDPDVGDAQSQADVQWRTNTGGSTGAWQPVTVVGPNPWWDAPAGTFPTGNIEWQVRTYDAQGFVGPYCASAFFAARTAPPAPTITSPVSGSTIPTSSVTVTFSEPGLDSFDWRVLADKAGVADPTVVLNAGNTVTDPTGRAFTVTGLPNNVTAHFQVRVSYQGLKSTWADQANPVSYTAPPKPTVVLTGNDTTGALLVTATNPAPTGTQPAVTANEVWVDDGAGFTRRKTDLPPNGTWAYRLPLSGRDYAGRVRLVAVAANGTTTTS